MDVSPLRIYHNPRCSKSRAACALIAESGQSVEVIDYLKTPPNKDELRNLLKHLSLRPQDIVRQGEEVYKQQYQGRLLSDDAWLDALVEHPILIERPIVMRGPRAVVARPPEKLLTLLQDPPQA